MKINLLTSISDSSHIVDCNLKLILGLIWTLILHYSISVPLIADEENVLQVSVKSVLINLTFSADTFLSTKYLLLYEVFINTFVRNLYMTKLHFVTYFV